MKTRITIVIVTICLLLAGYQFIQTKSIVTLRSSQDPNILRYVAVGDSYTIGHDVDDNEAWPTLLSKHLESEGIQI